MVTKTITLIAKPFTEGVEDLVIRNVKSYSVGYRVIYIEYNEDSVIAVARKDYERMTVTDEEVICIDSNDSNFKRINCRDDCCRCSDKAEDSPFM